MAVLSMCLFFAATCVFLAEGYSFTNEEAVHLDNTIRAVVDDMLARQASVYDARITKLESMHRHQNQKITLLENREKHQRKTIQNLTKLVSDLANRGNFRNNALHSPNCQKDEGKATAESKTVHVKTNEQSLLHDLKHEGGTNTRGSNGLNLRAIAVLNNVAFTAYLDHDVAHITAGQTVKFNRVHLNDGNGYNTFTGVFTVPVTGVYLFTYHWNSHFRITYLELLVDNLQHSIAIAYPVSDHETMGGQTVIVRANSGQSVWIQERWSTDGDIHGGHAQYATFAGILIY